MRCCDLVFVGFGRLYYRKKYLFVMALADSNLLLHFSAGPVSSSFVNDSCHSMMSLVAWGASHHRSKRRYPASIVNQIWPLPLVLAVSFRQRCLRLWRPGTVAPLLPLEVQRWSSSQRCCDSVVKDLAAGPDRFGWIPPHKLVGSHGCDANRLHLQSSLVEWRTRWKWRSQEGCALSIRLNYRP